jgi:DNA replication protein DnaC
MSSTYEMKAAEGLEQLGMTIAREQLDGTAQKAAAHKWSYSHFLGYLLDAELKGKHQRTVAMNTRFAHFPYHKHLEDFDLNAQPSIDPKLVDELATLRFLAEGRNIVLLGPPGVGKTHLAIALAVKALQAGHRAYFINAMDMARKLAEATERNHLPRLIKTLTKMRLLVLDEVGYLELSKPQAGLLFQVISMRYEAALPIILTSNKAFGDWASVFASDHVMASAALDRLLHKSTIINIRGDSYRLKEKRLAGISTTINHQTQPTTLQS